VVDGRWVVEGVGLWSWWLGNVRPCAAWRRLAAATKVIGRQPEAMLLELGGLDALGEFASFAAVVLPEGIGWDLVDGQAVIGPEGGPWRSVPEVWRLVDQTMREKRWPEGAVLDVESGHLHAKDGEDLGPLLRWER